MESVLVPEADVTNPPPQKIEQLVIEILIERIIKKRWSSPRVGCFLGFSNLFRVVELGQAFSSDSGVKSEFELLEEGSKGGLSTWSPGRGQAEENAKTPGDDRK